jgi:NAD(P)H-dependent FMN reductase
MKIIAFGASSSKKSINKTLATYVASLVKEAQVEVLDLNDYELPIYSQDKEQELGTPNAVKTFLQKINEADAVIVSFAEHNGSYSAAYKNIFDWATRTSKKVYENKKMIILSTSPGPGGAKAVFGAAVDSMPFFGAIVVGSMSVPSFFENFDMEKLSFKNSDLESKMLEIINKL